MRIALCPIAALLLSGAVYADTPASLLRSYAGEAAAASRPYAGPSASAGDRFFHLQHKDWSCASCHTPDPRSGGSHAVTGKAIRPLAPSVNSARFRDRAKADTWFRRNCNDTVGRECTAAEKADVLAYLISLGGAK
jgi:hypothetical protein